MHLVVDHVAKLEHVDHAHRSRLVELLARTAVVQVSTPAARNTRLRRIFVDLVERSTVENRRSELQSQLLAGPAEHGFVNLTEVHTRRHTQRVQADIDDRTVLEERHILVAHDTGHDTLVAVASRHLVAHLQLALLGDIDLGHLDHARLGEFVAVGEVVFLTLDRGIGLLPFDRIVVDRLLYQRIEVAVARPLAGPQVQVPHRNARLLVGDFAGELIEQLLGEFRSGRIEFHAEVIGDTRSRLALKQRIKFVYELLGQVGDLGCELLVELLDLQLLRALSRTLVLLAGTAVKLRVDHHTVQRRLRLERSVLHVAGLVAEDRTEQLLLGRRIALAFRSDLTDQDIARMHVGAYTDNTVGIQILGSVLAHVRNIRSQLLDAALGIADLHDVLIDMDRGENVLALNTLRNHDGILEVVTLPGHESHLQVTTQRQLALLRRITFGQDLAFGHLVARQNGRFQRDRRILVRTTVARQFISRNFWLERADHLLFRPLVFDLDLGCIRKYHLTVALGDDLDAAVGDHILFDTRTDDRRLAGHQRHGLAHHVRSHEGTVRIVVLQEGDQTCRDRRDLVRSYVHERHLLGRHNGEIGAFTGLDAVGLQEMALVVDRNIRLGDHLPLLLFGRIIFDIGIVEIHLSVGHGTVRSLDESHVGDLGIDAERRNQTDVRAFGRLDRAKTAVVRVVHVADFETSTVTRKTAGTEGRQTALVRDFGQRVDLVHELRKLRSAEERIDHRRERLGVDQIDRREDFVVTHVHTLADGTCHTHETYRKLVRKLLAHRADTTVREVVDIVHLGFRVDELDQVLDDGDDILARQRADRRIDVQIELLVDPVTADIAQVVTLVREEELLDHVAGRSLVGRLRSTQLAIDIHHGFFFGVTRIFL